MPSDTPSGTLRGDNSPVLRQRPDADLVGHHVNLNRNQPIASSRNDLIGGFVNSPRSLFSGQRHDPNSNAPNFDELSAGLGLPGIMRQTTNVDSSARSHKSHGSEGLSEGVLGNLIGRALDKPLTANTLAQYLNSEDVPLDGVAKITQGRKSYIQDRYPERTNEERQPMKLVPPPPGFMGERPRKIPVEERSLVNPAVMELPGQQVPTGPAAFGIPRRFSNLQSTNYPLRQGPGPELPVQRDHRLRAFSRTKRTDQGPEPSHADIYPDDATIMPRRPSYRPEPTEMFQGFPSGMSSEQQFHAVNTVVWPTPAEVYTQKPKSPPRRSAFARGASFTENRPLQRWSPPKSSSMADYMQQFGESSHPFAFTFPAPAPSVTPPFDIFADHHTPTYADIHDTDAEMECLLAILPKIYDLDLPEMPCDTRLLTPCQTDGTRYGLKCHGAGIGDNWMCPPAREGDAFRVRPRDHDGWGGWQWAIDRGWGNE
jgi:hypothetical protein